MRTDGSRIDAAENRARLVEGVGLVLERDGAVTLTELARVSGVSRATTYRNFSTADDAVLAYIDGFLASVEAEVDDGDSLRTVTEIWGRRVAERSPALVHVRSTEGFLARVRRKEPMIERIDRLVRRAIATDPSLSLSGPDLDVAVFLWNSLLDPRELLDLAEHLGCTVPEAASMMIDHVERSLRALSA